MCDRADLKKIAADLALAEETDPRVVDGLRRLAERLASDLQQHELFDAARSLGAAAATLGTPDEDLRAFELATALATRGCTQRLRRMPAREKGGASDPKMVALAMLMAGLAGLSASAGALSATRLGVEATAGFAATTAREYAKVDAQVRDLAAALRAPAPSPATNSTDTGANR